MIGRRRRLAPRALLAVVLLLTACAAPQPGPTPTPSVSPTALPTPGVTPSPTPPPRHSLDDDVDLAGLRHDSRDLLYRTPAGAVPAGTAVTLRLRTFREDVSGVRLRVYSLNVNAEQLLDMSRETDAVSCYEAALDAAGDLCDYWSVTLDNGAVDNLWYRFVVSDGARTVYYADDTAALDGGVGRATPAQIDNSYALMVHEPDFEAPDWARSAVVYQIFPDRFRNGDPTNDPQTGDVRYDDPVLALDWNELPEGYCRNYADASAETCPWRYDEDPPSWSPEIEGPRGRDYMGGDLAGVIEQLPYLQSLGVTAIYFNPVFDAGSNHGYDTQDYRRIDPYLGTNEEFATLAAEASLRGIRIILDGVFNHTSSDSPFFDRYGHYDSTGACEAVGSEWRAWYYMTTSRGPCTGPSGAEGSNYQSWFGFDTLPILLKNQPDLLDYFIEAPDGVTRRWLDAGADGWRMDVSGDPSFPSAYWGSFRTAVEETKPDALTISETWQKDSALLRNVRGDRFDTTMNYRLRDAVLGLLAPQNFDAKGFADSGDRLSASAFAARMLAQQEDYPAATYFSLMNLLDSHDTERALWTLTPGAGTRAARELDPDNLAEGKARLRLASLIQFSVPGMPTIYYGDEVGVTGDDDPDDRRTYPWADLGGTPDEALFEHYSGLAEMRRNLPALTEGDFRILLADDESGAIVIGRRTPHQAVIAAINSADAAQTVNVPLAGFAPDGTPFTVAFGTNGVQATGGTAEDGVLTIELPALGGVVLAAPEQPQAGILDLQPPTPPIDLRVADLGDGYVELAWAGAGNGVYNIYRSPLAGGGWLRLNVEPVTTEQFRDEGLENGRLYHYVVTALDEAGNESDYSNEVAEAPRLAIDSARLDAPAQVEHTISAVTPSAPICGEAGISGRTGPNGPVGSLQAQLGFGPAGAAPDAEAGWTWVGATYAGPADDRDRYCATLLPEATGSYDLVYRFTTSNGRYWLYADLERAWEPGGQRGQAGSLIVSPSADSSPPATPGGLRVVAATPAGIELTWDALDDPTLFAYEVLRASTLEGEVVSLGRTTEPAFADLDVSEGETFLYQVLAIDSSWNRSPPTEPLAATAEPRLVRIVFTVSVPAPTGAAVDEPVHIAGTLSRLAGDLPDWDPAATPLEEIDDTHWTITLEAPEGTELEYKYVLGDWLYVEKDGSCGETANRTLIASFGTSEQQQVSDTVANWRNVAPCGN